MDRSFTEPERTRQPAPARAHPRASRSERRRAVRAADARGGERGGRDREPEPHRPDHGQGRAPGHPAASSVAPQTRRRSAGGCSGPPRTGLHRDRADHEVGSGHHLHPHGRGLAPSLRGHRPLRRQGDRLLDVHDPGPPSRAEGRAHGLLAASRTPARDPSLRPRHPVHVVRLREVPEGAPHHPEHSQWGHCGDNAAAEGFFGMLKRERIIRRRHRTFDDARADVFDYIEGFHNPVSSVGLTPRPAGARPYLNCPRKRGRTPFSIRRAFGPAITGSGFRVSTKSAGSSRM
jgi:hypothetical protein